MVPRGNKNTTRRPYSGKRGFGKRSRKVSQNRAESAMQRAAAQLLAASGHCDNCEKPQALCTCALIKPIAPRTKLLILQHPQEPDKLLGSARLTNLSVKESKLRVGLSWANLDKAWDGQCERNKWAVLYMGSSRLPQGVPSGFCGLFKVDKQNCGVWMEDSELQLIEGIVLLDGTWSQAKTLWWRNPWLSKLKRVSVYSKAPSLYGELRKEPRKEGLSTLEAAACALSILERDPSIFNSLTAPFEQLLKLYRAAIQTA
ncbi:MAG: DTW domain-containing protein [Deltaproteobacteria bacterium]|nr:DTW domain-containing protein [Deltaproteobacteria bacterium]